MGGPQKKLAYFAKVVSGTTGLINSLKKKELIKPVVPLTTWFV